MGKNDLVLLDTVLKEHRVHAPTELTDPDFFEFFSFEQVLKDLELSNDELLDGQLGGGDEGGIDGLFVFEDDRLLDEDADYSTSRKGAELTLYVIQAKRKESFSEIALQRVSDALGDILDLANTREDIEELGLYHERFIERAEIFRTAVRRLANKRPQVRVVVAYASKGDTSNINAKVETRAERLRQQIEDALPGSVAEVTFYGARELYELSQREPTETLELVYHGTPQSDGENGYVALVELNEYFKFLTEDGSLRRYIFEGNVRDFQGKVEVNEAIRATLEDDKSPQFWWLNNGVTIVCCEARMMNQRFYLDEPLVVNGLQTSMVLFNHLSSKRKRRNARRLLLVRVIQTTVPAARDRVIRSTNSQTSVPAASLRATDEVQRDIERYFSSAGWFYDRRKNYYRNQGKPADKIISIPYLAQAMMAIGLRQPADARARPSSLLKDEKNYMRVFDADLDLGIYLWAAKTQKSMDAFLRSERAATTAEERTNLRFHLSMLAATEALGRRISAPDQLLPLVDTTFSEDELLAALDRLRKALDAYQKRVDLPMERVAKNRDFVTFLLDRYFPIKRRKRRPVASAKAKT